MAGAIKWLTFPDADELALSIQAQALVFDDPRSQALLEHSTSSRRATFWYGSLAKPVPPDGWGFFAISCALC